MKWQRIPILMLASAMVLFACMGSALGGSVHFVDQTLPQAMVGVYYHARVKVVGDDIPYVVSLTTDPEGGNEFPSELSITEDGVIYGTPQHAGVLSFALQVAYNVDTTTFCVLKLVVNPFSEDVLKQGGENTDIIGEGNDSLIGVANGINGGRVTMEAGKDTAYFISAKDKLYSIDKPYKKAAELYTAPEYGWLDSIGSNLYYFHRYYYEPDPAYTHVVQGYYITRICRDSIGKKGRVTLVDLNKKRISDLSVTDKIVLYIQGEEQGIIKRIPLAGGDPVSIRCYFSGNELEADMVFPYNGYAYLRNAQDGFLYRVALDGEAAQMLTDAKVRAYTVSKSGDEEIFLYADAGGTLYKASLTGGDKEAFGKLKASALNSDAEYLYFANAGDQNRLYRVSSGSPESPQKLTDFAVDQIYVFDTMLAVQKRGGQELYVLSKDGTQGPIRIAK